MSLKHWLVLILAFFHPALGRASDEGGSSIGGGGDTVICVAAHENSLMGQYSLDFVLTYRDGAKDLVPVTNWEASKKRILKLLQEKAPHLAASFSAFAEEVRNTDDFSHRGFGNPRPLGSCR